MTEWEAQLRLKKLARFKASSPREQAKAFIDVMAGSLLSEEEKQQLLPPLDRKPGQSTK